MPKLGFDLVILGMPTSGKDTQAALLRKIYSLRSLESGQHWRQVAKRHTPEGRRLAALLNRGRPTPISMMKAYLKEEIEKTSINKDLMFVGNPRLRPEAELLNKLLTERGRDYFVLFIQLPDKEIYKRSELRHRHRMEDSRHEFIHERIAWHKTEVGQTVKYFKSLKRLKLINGNQTVQRVHKEILKAIHDYQRSRTN